MPVCSACLAPTRSSRRWRPRCARLRGTLAIPRSLARPRSCCASCWRRWVLVGLLRSKEHHCCSTTLRYACRLHLNSMQAAMLCAPLAHHCRRASLPIHCRRVSLPVCRVRFGPRTARCSSPPSKPRCETQHRRADGLCRIRTAHRPCGLDCPLLSSSVASAFIGHSSRHFVAPCFCAGCGPPAGSRVLQALHRGQQDGRCEPQLLVAGAGAGRV